MQATTLSLTFGVLTKLRHKKTGTDFEGEGRCQLEYVYVHAHEKEKRFGELLCCLLHNDFAQKLQIKSRLRKATRFAVALHSKGEMTMHSTFHFLPQLPPSSRLTVTISNKETLSFFFSLVARTSGKS